MLPVNSLDEKAEILTRVGLFSGLKDNREALAALSAIMNKVEFSERMVLLTEGEAGAEFYILISGQVSVYKKTSENDNYKVAILADKITPGLGEGGLIENETRSATVICDRLCQFLVLNREVFSQFCDQHPAWAIPILKKISVQLIARLAQSNRDILLLHKALMNEIRG